jgi:hypothetical protein
MGLVIKFSISAGAAPGYSALIVKVGKVSSGSRFIFKREKETRPKRRMAIVNIDTVTRRRIEVLIKFFISRQP